VTGSLMERTPSGRALRKSEGTAEPTSADAARQAFLARLQRAVRSGDRHAISGMIAYPLRVNSAGGAHLYKDAKAVERDFNLIFTPRVNQVILVQRPDRLFTRDVGTMIGNGEVWFSQSCVDAACSRTGAMRITAINP